MMTPEQIKLMTETLVQLREGADGLRRDLSLGVLDGTPYAIVGDYKSADVHEPITLVYGEWEGHGKCFRALSIQPNHFCGMITMSYKAAMSAVKKLERTEPSLIFPRARHIRTIKQERLTELEQVIAHIEAAIKTGEAPSDAKV